MIKLKTSVLFVLIVLILGCSASQKTYETNTILDDLMLQKKFKIKVQSARPIVSQALSQVASSGLIPPGSTISRIDLGGDEYFLKIKEDSVFANLAYYGERHIGGGYTNNTGIDFKGVPENIEITKDEITHNYTIKFSINDKSENFMVITKVATNLTSTVNITSSHRSRITYSGDLIALEEE